MNQDNNKFINGKTELLFFNNKLTKFISSDYLVALLYLLLVVIFFHKVLIHPDWIVYGTDAMDRYSLTGYIRDMALNNGQFPLWISAHFSGMPHIDATHSIQLNIFCLLYYIMPLPLAFNLFMIIHFFFAGFFTYIFAKDVGMKKPSAFMSGLMFMFSGVLISHMFVGHMAKIVTWAYIPLLLFLVGRGVERRRIVYFLLASIIMGQQFLGGHMQMAYYSTLFVGVFALFKIYSCREKKEKWNQWFLKPGAYVVLFATIAVLLYSVQLVPSYLYTQKYSERSGGTSYEFSTSWSFAPKELPSIFLRDPFGWGWPKTEERIKNSGVVTLEGDFPDPFVPYWGPMPQRLAGEYFGVLPFILAFIGIVFRRDKFSWFFAGAAVVTLLLSMGKYTPLYWIAYKFIYGFHFFRVPLSIYALTALCLSILAGRGVDFLISEKTKKDTLLFKRFIIVLGCVAAFVLLIALYLNLSGESLGRHFVSVYDGSRFSQYITDFKQLALDRILLMQKDFNILSAYMIGTVILLVLVFRRKLNATVVVGTLFLLIILDLWSYGYDFIKYAKIDDNAFYGKYDTVKHINKDKKSEKFRVMAWDDRSMVDAAINVRSFSYHGIELINGRHDLAPIYYKKMLSASMQNPKLLSLLNTKYVLVTKNNDLRRLFRRDANIQETMPLVMKDEVFKLYENKGYLDRAFIVNRVRIVNDEKYVLGYMTKESFDPSAEVVLEEKPVHPDGKVNDPAEANRAIIERYTPNHIAINAELKQEGVLVLADTYYPDWKVYVDGVEGKIYKADYALRGVYLTAGSHQVEFVYDSKTLKITGAVSIVTLILTLAGIMFICLRKRKNDEIKGHGF